MSTLNINELKALATTKNLLGTDYNDNNFSPSSYDLRIGSIFKDGKIYSADFQPKNFPNIIDINPSEIVSMLTLEKVSIPLNCIGTVFAINKHSSKGLLILNPGHIDPGFSGHISICAINLSNEIKTMSIGEPIFTLILQKLATEITAKEGYKNLEWPSRKEEEQNFLKTKSKKLSNSFFDLVTKYGDAKKTLGEIIWNKFLKQLGNIIKVLVFISALAGIYAILPENLKIFDRQKPVTNDSSNVNSKYIPLIKQKDDTIKILKDSIDKLKPNP
jgi:deoxycytidine triphosphate deaminase